MVYGVQAAQDVLLSQIGRELGESILLGKVENRLSRNLAREGLADTLHDALLEHAARHIRKDTLLILDPSDIQKEYAACIGRLFKRHGKGWKRTSGVPPPPDPQLRLPFDFASC